MQDLTTKQAAARLKLCPQRVRVLLKAGRIPGARKHGNMWLIPEAAIAGYRVGRRSKLSERDKDEIRYAVMSGFRQATMAHHFGVSRSLVCRIISGER